MTDDLGASEVRDLTGTPAHTKLRAYWVAKKAEEEEQKGTSRRRQGTGDILGNISNAIAARNNALEAHYDAKATRAWELYQSGMTREQAALEVGMSQPAIRRRWLAKGWMTR